MLFLLVEAIVKLAAGFTVPYGLTHRLVRAENTGHAVLKMICQTGGPKKVATAGFAKEGRL